MKTRDRVAWLALAVLRGVEQREGMVKRSTAVKVIVEKLGLSERQARNVLGYLVRQQMLAPWVEGLRVKGFRLTAKGHAVLENLGL